MPEFADIPVTAEEDAAFSELLSENELRESLSEAEVILAQLPRQYQYTTNYKGGPRNIPPEALTAAAVELTSTRLVHEEMDDRAAAAKLQHYEKVDEMLGLGIPVDFIAEHSGLAHRSSVYRAVRQQLPKLRQKAASARDIRRRLRG